MSLLSFSGNAIQQKLKETPSSWRIHWLSWNTYPFLSVRLNCIRNDLDRACGGIRFAGGHTH
jgi:hypothetical protein